MWVINKQTSPFIVNVIAVCKCEIRSLNDDDIATTHSVGVHTVRKPIIPRKDYTVRHTGHLHPNGVLFQLSISCAHFDSAANECVHWVQMIRV